MDEKRYYFANGYDNPELAPIASGVKSQDLEAGLGTLVDITAFKKLNVTAGERLDTVYARVGTLASVEPVVERYDVMLALAMLGDIRFRLEQIVALFGEDDGEAEEEDA